MEYFCKDNTSQVHFRSVNLYKEFPYEFGTQSDKPNNMWNDLKHVETHECVDQ